MDGFFFPSFTHCIPWWVHRSSRDSLGPCCTLCSSRYTPRCDTWTSLARYTESLWGDTKTHCERTPLIHNILWHLHTIPAFENPMTQSYWCIIEYQEITFLLQFPCLCTSTSLNVRETKILLLRKKWLRFELHQHVFSFWKVFIVKALLI